MPRHVRGLKKVEMLPNGPFPKDPKLTGRAAEGIRYQKKVHKALGELERFGTLHEEPWIRFCDTYGVHWCRPDSVLETHDRLLVVEAKLSLRRYEDAMTQLNKLYRPTLEELFRKPVAMLMAFRHWLPGSFDLPMVDDPEELLYYPHSRLAKPVGWHFM